MEALKLIYLYYGIYTIFILIYTYYGLSSSISYQAIRALVSFIKLFFLIPLKTTLFVLGVGNSLVLSVNTLMNRVTPAHKFQKSISQTKSKYTAEQLKRCKQIWAADNKHVHERERTSHTNNGKRFR